MDPAKQKWILMLGQLWPADPTFGSPFLDVSVYTFHLIFWLNSHNCYLAMTGKYFTTLHHYISFYRFFSSHRSVMRRGVQPSKLLLLCLFQLFVAPSALPRTPTSLLVDLGGLVWSLLSGWLREGPANWCWLPDQGSETVRHNATRLLRLLLSFIHVHWEQFDVILLSLKGINCCLAIENFKVTVTWELKWQHNTEL